MFREDILKKYKSSLLVIAFIYSGFLQAEARDLDDVIKTQQVIDRTNSNENKILKKDVYSTIEDVLSTKIELPIEANCKNINELIIENDFINDSGINEIKRSIAGRCLGAQGIKKLAIIVQDYFINKGYITTRIAIPNQNLSSQKLILRVEPGRIEDIIISDMNIMEEILPFEREKILNLRDIEQGLEVLQRVPGNDIKINIEPGANVGNSNVLINSNLKKNWNGKAWLNNWGDDATGKMLFGGAGYFYNLANMNDIFYISGSTNTERNYGTYNSFNTFYSVPWGYWDYELFYSKSHSRQLVKLDIYDFNYSGKSEYLSLKATRVVYRDSDKKVSLSGELLSRQVKYQLEDIELALQKRNMKNIRVGVNYNQNFTGAILGGTLSYQRFLPYMGSVKTPDMESGDVSSQSNIINLDANYTKILDLIGLDTYYNLKIGMQYSPGNLTLQDQFSVGNRSNVRGFENSNGLYSNNGFFAQNTINIMTGMSNLIGYAGTDYGQTWDKLSARSAHETNKILGATIGLKDNINELVYDISFSSPLLSPKESNNDKLNINFSISYQI